LDASGFSVAIAEKSRVKDDVEMVGELPEPPLDAELLAEGELLPPPPLLQAARATPAVTASADVHVILVVKFKRSPQVSAETTNGRCASMRSSVQETAAASAFDGNFKPDGINGVLTSPPRHKNSVNKVTRLLAVLGQTRPNGCVNINAESSARPLFIRYSVVIPE
jgi:hypothetical protein